MLEIDGLSAGYGPIKVLDNVSLRIDKGEIISIIGANGMGKSTLLKVVCGLLKPSLGRITYKGKDISSLEPHQVVDEGIVLVPEGRQLFADMTVEENLFMGCYNRRASFHRKASMEMVYGLFPILKNRRRQRCVTMSGGEQQMLAVARGLMAQPELLLLDEVSWGLSPLMAEKIYADMISISHRGLTVIISEQNADLALKVSRRAYVVSHGQIKLSGDSSQLVGNPEVQRLYMGLAA